MKVYVAAKWEERERARNFMRSVRLLGHVITHDWTHETDEGLSGAGRHRYLGSCATSDLQAVRDCDVLVLLHNPQCRGAYVELGIALGLAKVVIVVGSPRLESAEHLPVFYWLPSVLHAALEHTALAALSRDPEHPSDEVGEA